MNYIIIGGTGFIGTHLTILIKQQYPDAQVYNLDIVKPGTPLLTVKNYVSPLKEEQVSQVYRTPYFYSHFRRRHL